MSRTLLFLAVLTLGACTDNEADKRSASAADSPRPARTVLQFLEDPAALDETWSRCRNDRRLRAETTLLLQDAMQP